jgi:hypothetical protein
MQRRLTYEDDPRCIEVSLPEPDRIRWLLRLCLKRTNLTQCCPDADIVHIYGNNDIIDLYRITNREIKTKPSQGLITRLFYKVNEIDPSALDSMRSAQKDWEKRDKERWEKLN